MLKHVDVQASFKESMVWDRIKSMSGLSPGSGWMNLEAMMEGPDRVAIAGGIARQRKRPLSDRVVHGDSIRREYPKPDWSNVLGADDG